MREGEKDERVHNQKQERAKATERYRGVPIQQFNRRKRKGQAKLCGGRSSAGSRSRAIRLCGCRGRGRLLLAEQSRQYGHALERGHLALQQRLNGWSVLARQQMATDKLCRQ